MRRSLLLGLPLSLLVLCGCFKKDQHFGGQLRPKVYRAIVSLSPGTTELACSLGDAQSVKGRTAYDDFPEYAVAKIPVVASLKPDYEKIKQLKPDLVVYDADLYSDQDVAKIKELGAEVFALDAKTVTGFEEQLYKLANKIGGETNFSGYVDKIVAAAASAKGTPVTPTPKVAVLLPGSGGQSMAAGSSSFLADVVAVAGGKFVGPTGPKFMALNAEQMITENPDVIIVPSSKLNAAATVKSVLNDPKLKPISAIKNGMVVPIDENVLLRRGSRVDKLIDAIHRTLASKK